MTLTTTPISELELPSERIVLLVSSIAVTASDAIRDACCALDAISWTLAVSCSTAMATL